MSEPTIDPIKKALVEQFRGARKQIDAHRSGSLWLSAIQVSALKTYLERVTRVTEAVECLIEEKCFFDSVDEDELNLVDAFVSLGRFFEYCIDEEPTPEPEAAILKLHPAQAALVERIRQFGYLVFWQGNALVSDGNRFAPAINKVSYNTASNLVKLGVVTPVGDYDDGWEAYPKLYRLTKDYV